MFTSRRLVLVLALAGTAVAVLTYVVLTLPLGLGTGSNSPEGVSVPGFLILLLGILGGGGLVLAAGIIALVQTARIKRWGWFGGMLGEGVALLLLAGIIAFYAPWVVLSVPLTLVIYGVVGPSTPAVQAT